MSEQTHTFMITLSSPLTAKESQVLDFFWGVVQGVFRFKLPIFSDQQYFLLYEAHISICICLKQHLDLNIWRIEGFQDICRVVCDASPRILFTPEVICKYMDLIKRKCVSIEVIQSEQPAMFD